jgi:DNA-binding response OmpR family regulator
MQAKNIVIVDDEPDILEFLRYNLVKEGYLVNTFDSGAGALEYSNRNNPDVIVSDWMMPGTSGLELLIALKTNPYTKHIPFIMITCRNSQEDISSAFDLGAEAYMTKPFLVNELSDRIKKICIK